MKRVLIAGLAVALNAGCVATYVHVQPDPVRVTVWRAALVYRADCRITQNGVESYNGRPDAETVKAVADAPWWMRVIAWFKGG
jgi:hypothetical protein